VTMENEAYQKIINSNLFDDPFQAQKTPLIGTWNAFDWNLIPTRKIDYIFTSRHWKINRMGILTDNYGKKYPSDHFPVLVEVEISK
jgi:endonuclease/exonuclease/phosphatase family metal-dependent hydrolase